MNTTKLNDWLQIAAAVGVIAGLGLVAYEVRVSNRIGFEQANAASLERWQAIYEIGSSREFADLWVRAHENNELSRSDAFILNNFIDTVLGAIEYDMTLVETESVPIARESVYGDIQYYTVNDYFKRRWSVTRHLYLESVRQAVDGALNSPSQRDVLAYLDYIRGATNQLE